jgi:hypothetical protein
MRFFLFFLCFFAGSLSAQNKPLSVHPGYPTYFMYQGKPVLLVGSGEHYGAVLNPDFDYTTYFKTLKNDGLNYTRIFTGQYAESYDSGTFGIPKNTLGPAKGKLLTPYQRSQEPGYVFGGNKFDLDRWDEAYWTRLRDVVATAKAHDVIVEVTLFTALYSDDGWLSSPLCAEANINKTEPVAKNDAFTLKNKRIVAYQKAFVQRIASELNGFDNVLYEIQNEPWADGGVITDSVSQYDTIAPAHAVPWQQHVEVANPDRMEWQHHIARVLTEAEAAMPNKHLIAMNHANFRGKIEQPDPLVDVYHFHYAHPIAIIENRHLKRPITCDETGFNGTTDEPYRRQAWRFFMAGGAMFDHLDYSFTVAKPDGTDTQEAPGGGSPTLRKQFVFMKKLLEKEAIWTYMPANSDMTTVAKDTRVHMMWRPQKSNAIVYAETYEKNWAAMVKLPAGRYKITYYDPVTCKRLGQKKIKNKKSEIQLAPWKQEKETVMLIERL